MAKQSKKRSFFWIFSILVIFIVFQAPVSSYLGAQERAKRSQVRANMHKLNLTVKKYAKQHNGKYPKDLETLYKHALEKGYWEDFENPMLWFGGKGIGLKGAMTMQIIILPKNECAEKGLVIYSPDMKDKTYRVYGCDKDKRLIQFKGSTFYLAE